MPNASKAKPRLQPSLRPGSYLQVSQEPLQSLFFLLPLIVIYELGTLRMEAVSEGRHETIKAYSLLARFFEIVGVTGYYLPGLAVIVILFCWHLARRDRWRFDPGLYVVMWGEAILWALPLLVWGIIFFREPVAAMGTGGAALHGALGQGGPVLARLGALSDQITLSVGAGIYEELLFRLIAIAVLHMIFCDLLALPNAWGATLAILISALAFGYYHFTDLDIRNWHAADWNKFFFISCAGVYLALLYVLRGFGIVAGGHASYDVILALLKIFMVHGQ